MHGALLMGDSNLTITTTATALLVLLSSPGHFACVTSLAIPQDKTVLPMQIMDLLLYRCS